MGRVDPWVKLNPDLGRAACQRFLQHLGGEGAVAMG
jgi:hypothetical protein